MVLCLRRLGRQIEGRRPFATGADVGEGARIDQAVGHVDHEVGEDVGHGYEKDGSLHDDVVAPVDRLDAEQADPRLLEDDLDDEGAADEAAEVEAGHRHQ